MPPPATYSSHKKPWWEYQEGRVKHTATTASPQRGVTLSSNKFCILMETRKMRARRASCETAVAIFNVQRCWSTDCASLALGFFNFLWEMGGWDILKELHLHSNLTWPVGMGIRIFLASFSAWSPHLNFWKTETYIPNVSRLVIL